MIGSGCSSDEDDEKAGSGPSSSAESPPREPATGGNGRAPAAKKHRGGSKGAEGEKPRGGRKGRIPKRRTPAPPPDPLDPNELARGRAPGNPKTEGVPASAPPFVGISTRTVGEEEAKRIGGGFGASGSWKLVLGTVNYNLQSRRRLMVGSIRVSGDRMVFGPSGKAVKRTKTNPCGASRGVYRWSMRGRKLTFKKVRDGCSARAALTGGPWTNGTER